MDFSLLVGPMPLLALAALALAAGALLYYPLRRSYPDDQGDGVGVVLLPAPHLPLQRKALELVGVFVVLAVIYHATKGPLDPDTLYAHAVTRLAGTAVVAPAQLYGYFDGFQLGLRFLVAGTIVSLAVVVDGASPLRRLVIASQALCYLAATLTLDALLSVVEIVAGIPVGPSTLLGSVVALGVGFFAMSRTLFVNFALPKPSSIEFYPRPRAADAVTLILVTFAGSAVCAAGTLWLYRWGPPGLQPLLVVLLPIPFAEGAFLTRSVILLGLAWLTKGHEPPVGEVQPPVQIIIPAYNEEEVIVETLQAIDLAASHYAGCVGVVLANDGSSDRTHELATRTIAGFGHASGKVIDVRHGGKSATLNAALAETTTDLVVRIDADTLVGEWSLHFVSRWFDDPEIGLVEAMMFPRWRPSPFPRMRLFEELKQFGINHRAMEVVDGVNVVPGVFTAFRREPALSVGGFTVGMNGEDGDFTFKFSRLGYRSHLDPKVVVYEDVPPTYSEMREQRVRWDRATLHHGARNGPLRAGLATPKVWFSHFHQFFSRVYGPVSLTLGAYLCVLAVFHGTYRVPVVVYFAARLVISMGTMAIDIFAAAHYHHTRRIGWLLAWPIWQVMLMLFSAEAWLSLPVRPAGMRAMQPAAVAEAVVH